MKSSLAKRIFRTILAIGVFNVAITLITTELIYEDIEETNLNIGLTEERLFFEKQIEDAQVWSWRSALLTALYIPDGDTTAEIPEIFRGKPVPFAAEVDAGSDTYLISIERVADPPGVIYLAQDISVLEDREDRLQEVGIILFAVFMLLLSLLMAHLGSRRIVRPLRSLSRQIRGINPGTSINRIQGEFGDRELEEITQVLNELLEALDAYIHREKALVRLASHELRTPIAVISGALDVLEQRDSLDNANRRTIDRIRQAAGKMQADVDALLKLSHRSGQREKTTVVDLAACVRAVVGELEHSAPRQAGRVSYDVSYELDDNPPTLEADPTLVHMLLRNLVQNAIRHTRGAVEITIAADRLSIADAGTGLPSHIQSQLIERPSISPVPEDGLGLFIVRLICERLDWQLQVSHSGSGGTVIDIFFAIAGRIERGQRRGGALG